MNVYMLERDPSRELTLPDDMVSYPDPVASARSLCDVHLRTQIREAAQILCTAAIVHGYPDSPYARTYENHVVTKWVVRSRAAWLYTLEHSRAIHEQIVQRFGHSHRSWIALAWCSRLVDSPRISRWVAESATRTSEPDYEDDGELPRGMSGKNAIWPWALGVPKRFQDQADPVGSYRAYYAWKERMWSYNARRASLARAAVGYPDAPGVDPAAHSHMVWTAPAFRPAWMPFEQLTRFLTDDQFKAAAALKPDVPVGLTGNQLRSFAKEYMLGNLEKLDEILETPEEYKLDSSVELSVARYSSFGAKGQLRYAEVTGSIVGGNSSFVDFADGSE